MIKTPLVSVCIPTFNRKKILSHTLESVISQTYTNIEIIISDNCSTDGTFELVKDYAQADSRFKIFQLQKNLGPVENWKNCHKNTSGSFIKFLWSDDYIDNNFIEIAVNKLGDDIGFIYAPVKWYDIDSMKVHHDNIGFKQPSSKTFSIDYFVESLILNGTTPVSASCALFRKSVIDDLFGREINNCLDLNCDSSGAGIDALMFLYAYKKYDVFSYIDSTYAYYGFDHDGITVRSGDKLTPYYFSTFYDFLMKYKNDKILLSKFKARVLFYRLFCVSDIKSRKLLNNLLNLIDARVSYSFFLKYVTEHFLTEKFSWVVRKGKRYLNR